MAFALKIGGLIPKREYIRKILTSAADKNGNGIIEKDQL